MRFFFTLFFALHFSFLSAQWQQLDAPGVVNFGELAEGTGQVFAFRQNSLLRRSPSNGVGWEATTPLNAQLLSVEADDNILVVLTTNEQAFQSIDNGTSWQQLPIFPVQGGWSQIFVRDGNIYAYYFAGTGTGANGLYRYRSIQNDWLHILPLPALTYHATFAFLGIGIWASLVDNNSSNHSLQYSLNAGASWQTLTTMPQFSGIFSIAVDNNRLVAVSGNSIYSSTNNGASWTAGNLPSDTETKVFADDGSFYAIVNNQLYSSFDGFQNYTSILSGLGQIHDFVAINGFWVASTFYGVYRSPQNLNDWQWVPSGLPNLYYYQKIKSAGGTLFYTERQTAFSTNAGDTWQATNGLHKFYDVLYHNGYWYSLTFENFMNIRLWQSANLKDWAFRSILPTDSSSRYWAYVGNTMVNSSSYNGSAIYISNDDGLNWQTQGTSPGSNLFAYNNLLYSHETGTSELFQSSNFGANWSSLGPVLAADPNVSTFLTLPGKIYAFSSQNLLTSTDGGSSWVARSLLPINPTQLSVVGEVTSNGSLIVLINDVFYLTHDDGIGWAPIMSGYTATPLTEIATLGNTVFSVDIYGIPWKRDISLVNPAQYAGQVYKDLDNDGLLDSGEPPLPKVALRLNNIGQFTTSISDGTFSMLTEAQSDILTAISPGQYCTFNPPNYAVNTTTTQLNFGLYCPPGITDLAVSLVNTPPFRPGFDTDIFLTARNLGNDAANGSLVLTLDPVLQFISATPAVPLVGNTLTWSFSAFQSLDQMNFVVRVNTPAGTPLGNTLCNSAQITPNATDQNPADNTFNLCRVVIGSYDPNDKQVDKTAYPPTNPGSEPPLTYTVRFQNTGTYLASLVVIKDTLSPNLDPATLQVLSASHPFTWSLRGNGIVEFRFDGINLPDVNSDEPGSHGFAQFSVKPKSGLPLGEMTDNTAYIYFDFNTAIITNTVTSTLVSTHEPVLVVQLSALPNPAHETVRILFPEPEQPGILNLQLYDLSGRLVQVVRMEGNEAQFDVRGLADGIYQVRGSDENRIYVAKFEVIH